MKNSMMIFESLEFGKLRTLMIDGAPWLVEIDVASALGYSKSRNALAMHVDNEDKTTALIQGGGSNYKSKAILINESGLYSLILSSKLPSAKAFKHWVTAEVLPSIRKHGAYVSDSVLDQLEEHPELITDFIQQLRDENAEAKRNRELLEQARAENARLAPKAGYYDNFVNVDDLTCLRYTAKELGVPQNKFIGYLLEKGYAFRDRHRDGRVFAKASKRNDPLFMTRDFYLPGGEKSEYTLVTPAGKAYFKKRAEKIRAWEPGIADGEKITEEAVFAE